MRHPARHVAATAILSCAAVGAAACSSTSPAPVASTGPTTTSAAAGRDGGLDGAAVVVKVVDGDTLHVRIRGRQEKVRLIGIDTPETHGPGGLKECFGPEAASRLRALTPVGADVRLVRDEEPRDRYGRLLAYVYLAGDDTFVNEVLVAEGFAAAKSYRPNTTHEPTFRAAEADARAEQRGLWGACGGPDTPIAKQ